MEDSWVMWLDPEWALYELELKIGLYEQAPTFGSFRVQ